MLEKLKVVTLEIVCYEEDIKNIENELMLCEAAECFGLHCLGTKVRDLTAGELEIMKAEKELFHY